MKKSELTRIIREEVRAVLKEAVELVHVYNTKGELQGTGELVKTKANKSLIRWDGSSEEWIDSKLVKLVESTINEEKIKITKKRSMELARLSEGAYESATRNELAMYLSLLSTTLKGEKTDGNTAMVKFLTKDIEEVKAALKAKGGSVTEA